MNYKKALDNKKKIGTYDKIHNSVHRCQCVVIFCKEATMRDENGNVWKTVNSGETWEIADVD